MGLPLGPPHQVGGLMFSEIDAAHRDLARIEPGGAKPRIVRRPVERDRTREGLHREDRQARRLCLSMDPIGIRSLEHETVEAHWKTRDLRAACTVPGKSE